MKKIKSINFKLFVFLGLIAFFVSCTNDMNVSPKDDDDFTSEAFYKDPSSYKQFLSVRSCTAQAHNPIIFRRGPHQECDRVVRVLH